MNTTNPHRDSDIENGKEGKTMLKRFRVPSHALIWTRKSWTGWRHTCRTRWPRATRYAPTTGIKSIPSHGVRRKGPGDSKIWKLHTEKSEEYDKALVEGWKTNTDSILIFVRLIYLTPPCPSHSSHTMLDWPVLGNSRIISHRDIQDSSS